MHNLCGIPVFAGIPIARLPPELWRQPADRLEGSINATVESQCALRISHADLHQYRPDHLRGSISRLSRCHHGTVWRPTRRPGLGDYTGQYRHLAMVVTISGDIDARNTARVTGYITDWVPVGDALVLDLSGVDSLAARSISVLSADDDAWHSAELPWALVTSHAVNRVLRISQDDDILPVVSSVSDAMQYFVDLVRVRQQVPVSARSPKRPQCRVDAAADVSRFAMKPATDHPLPSRVSRKIIDLAAMQQQQVAGGQRVCL
jgi:anti-anti-sigma factor